MDHFESYIFEISRQNCIICTINCASTLNFIQIQIQVWCDWTVEWESDSYFTKTLNTFVFFQYRKRKPKPISDDEGGEPPTTAPNAGDAKQKESGKDDLATLMGGENKDFYDVVEMAAKFQPTGNTLDTTNVKTPVPFLLKHTLREYQHIGLGAYFYSIFFRR